jgi:lipopolysaccharide export system protein LptC
MRADRGVFNTQAERLVMQDRITVATSSGITGELKHASLDMKTQTLRSHQPVSFQLPNGTVSANALTFSSGKHVLTFRGRVKVHLDKKDKGDKDKSASKPAPETKGSAQAGTGTVTEAAAPAHNGAAPE